MSASDEVRKVLDDWRKKHGWQPGMVWDPYTAAYVWPPGTKAAPPLSLDSTQPKESI
jgi:hypothetical protein